MKVEYGERKIITSLNTDAKPGCFALDTGAFVFENCRERFAKNFTQDTTGLYFKHLEDGGLGVAGFVLKTEAVLRLNNFSRFSETNRNTIIWVEPSNFWRVCPMRRSLLTVLLRCGTLYLPDEDNFEEALFTQEYMVPTKRAMMRFLFGFTKYVGPDLATESTIQVKGWKSVFEGKSDAEVKTMLLPETFSRTPPPELSSCIWL